MIIEVKIMDMLDRITELMEMHKDSKASLSRNAGIPYTTIDGLYKRRCDNIYISTVRKICDYYGVTLDYLVLGNDGLSKEAVVCAAKYDRLDDSGRELIDLVIDHELERAHAASPISGITQEDLQRGAEKTAQPDGKAANR